MAAILTRSTLEMTSSLPTEVILRIAEHLDMESLKNFMRTSKTINNIIPSYEGSICRNRARLSPRGRNLVPLQQRIVTSSRFSRRIILCDTFQFLPEIECRHRNTDVLLQENLLNIEQELGMQELSDLQRSHLEPLFQRAISQLDHLVDMAVNMGTPDHLSVNILEFQRQLDCTRNTGSGGLVVRSAITAIHEAQQKYIRELNIQEAALLYILLLRGTRWCKENMSAGFSTIPLLFGEMALRHGTWFLWSYFMGGERMKSMAGEILATAERKLLFAGHGIDNLQNGLHMTLAQVCQEKGEWDSGLDSSVAVVKNLIGVPLTEAGV